MLGTLLKWFGGEGSKPTSGKSKGGATESGTPAPKLNKLYEGDRSIHDLHSNSAVLRIWLPVPAMAAMEESMAEMGITAAKYLREFLVVCLYGGHELLRMKAEKTGLYYVPPPVPDNGIRFSRGSSDECVPGMGKNIVPIKLHLNEKMKADIEALAKNAGIPLGQFVREILISHFLGHTVWPERTQTWTTEQKEIADGWEGGRVEAEYFRWSTLEERDATQGRVNKI